ncbi:MAG: serine/threonine protein kinase [Desulfurococcaceae archaeon]
MAQGLCLEEACLDGVLHFLEPQPDDYIARILCYPRKDCQVLQERLETLLEEGFVYFVECCTNVMGLRILGKGYTGVTVLAFHKSHGLGALKLLRVDSRRESLAREAEMLTRVQPSGLAPVLYSYGDFYLFRELVPLHACAPIDEYLARLLRGGMHEEVKRVLLEVLHGFYRVDLLGVDHTEIGRPRGHVFYCKSGLRVIDWESARVSNKPGNLTSFTSFLIFRFREAGKLQQVLSYDAREVLKALRLYKQSYSESAFRGVLASLRLLQ